VRRLPLATLAVALLVGMFVMAGVPGCTRDGFCIDCEDAGGAGGAGDSGTYDNRDGGVNILDASARHDAGPLEPCTPRSDGQELCNDLDDDCDGLFDEGFDFATNPQHCGSCNQPCRVENTEATCVSGACVPGACFDGFADLDSTAGCEYRCPVFPAQAENCNGTDDDCDGVTDEDLPAPPAGLCNTRSGTPCAGTNAACETREGITTWYCQYGSGVEFDPSVPNGIVLEETLCNGSDGDCDADADDPWPAAGEPCSDDGIGVCRDVGVTACDPTNNNNVFCDLSALPDAQAPSTELCNDRDDDCNGVVDDGVVDDMVHVTVGGNFYIFRYEASHPDASDTSPGLATGRACSNPNVLPWTFVTYDQAADACTAAGKRLCTGAEWQAACGALSYPYGAAYQPATCNGADNAAAALLPTGSLATCQSTVGAYDLSGNAKEWTTQSPAAETYVVRGGSHQSPELGLTCQTTLSQAAASPGQAGIGFRCCSNTAP